jgi:hypothetical protein
VRRHIHVVGFVACLLYAYMFEIRLIHNHHQQQQQQQQKHVNVSNCETDGSCAPSSHEQQQQQNDDDVSKQQSTIVHPQLPDECPLAVKNAVGIYKNPSNQKFANTVLLTASNADFVDMLYNWEAFADQQHGLKYAVLAMDDAIYQQLGPHRAVPSISDYVISNTFTGRSNKKYLTLVCNKMRMILDILQKCKVDVVFSDADNIFLQDPFQHDLGKLILSGSGFDYLYTTNDAWTEQPRSHPCIRDGTFAEREGNTGLEYIRSKATWVQTVMHRTLFKCDRPKNRHHDQTLFWKIMANHRTPDWVHCNKDTFANLDNNNKASFIAPKQHANTSGSATTPTMCCLDPHYYAVGAARPAKPETLVAFHANYVKTFGEKKERLATWVDGWRNNNSAAAIVNASSN